jgi:hypothetical protein
MEITEENLRKFGFKRHEQDGEVPSVTWNRDRISIWNYNDEYWIVDALDQGGINVEFQAMEQLAMFWQACMRPPITL